MPDNEKEILIFHNSLTQRLPESYSQKKCRVLRSFQTEDFSAKNHRRISGDIVLCPASTLVTSWIGHHNFPIFHFLISKIEIMSRGLPLTQIFQYKKKNQKLDLTRNHTKDCICLKLFFKLNVNQSLLKYIFWLAKEENIAL